MKKYECLKNMKHTNSINWYGNQTAFNVLENCWGSNSIDSNVWSGKGHCPMGPSKWKFSVFLDTIAFQTRQALPNKNILASLIFCFGNRTVWVRIVLFLLSIYLRRKWECRIKHHMAIEQTLWEHMWVFLKCCSLCLLHVWSEAKHVCYEEDSGAATQKRDL